MNINTEQPEVEKFNNVVNEAAAVIRLWLHDERWQDDRPASITGYIVREWRKAHDSYNYDDDPDGLDNMVIKSTAASLTAWYALNAGQWIGQYGQTVTYDEYSDVWDSALYEATM